MHKSRRLPLRYLEPYCFSGLLDDPLLYLNARPLGRAILFDCGQIHHLAKRVIRSLDAVFITHAHMDHFMGFDTLIRHTHVAPRTIDVFGPPGIAGKVEHKLAAYDWNLTEPYWCTIRVHELHPAAIVSSLFPGAAGFRREQSGEAFRSGPIYRNAWLEVEAAALDHKIPSVAYRVTERATFLVDEERMAAAGYVAGPWLRELKKRFYGGDFGAEPLPVLRRRGERVEECREDAGEVWERVAREGSRASLGYVTDIGCTAENFGVLREFLDGVTLLAMECTFLAADRDKARESHHLCTDDVDRLCGLLRPQLLLPLHLSKSYVGRSETLYDELHPPAGTTVLRLPEHLTPRPLLAEETPRLRP